MANHAARDHAQWSASATDRNWHCPGALALTMDLPEQTNSAADWGTVCHEIGELCLRDGVDAVSFIGTTRKGKEFSFEVDDEMADTAQTYVDYCRSRIDAYKAETGKNALVFVEEKFSLAALNPPFEAGGTGDCVMIFPDWQTLEVVDLKGGRGVVVEAKGNPQGRTYGLGAVLKHTGHTVRKIIVTIVQPRAGHPDGRIRSDVFDMADLVEWTTDLMAAMDRAWLALAQHPTRPVTPNAAGKAYDKLPDAVWTREHLSAGSHCKFCKAAGFCPALEQKATDAAGVWFDDLDKPRISNAPDAMSPEKLAQTLDMLDMIDDWCNAVRAHAHREAEAGTVIPGYQLVEKIGNRAWKPDVLADDIAALLMANGKSSDAAYAPRKAASPAQVEKALGAKNKGLLADLVERPSRGTNLVSTASTTRPAVTPLVQQHLTDLDAKPNLFD